MERREPQFLLHLSIAKVRKRKQFIPQLEPTQSSNPQPSIIQSNITKFIIIAIDLQNLSKQHRELLKQKYNRPRLKMYLRGVLKRKGHQNWILSLGTTALNT